MSIRIPGQVILSIGATDTGTASIAGGVPFPFQIPQDTDNLTVKFTASVVAAGASVTLQTSDDGGTTYYDVARTSIVSNGIPQWLSASTFSPGITTSNASVVAVGSVITTGQTIGSAQASTLGSRQASGLPILGIQNRLFVIYSGNITTSSVLATVRVNQQSGGR